MKDLDTVRKNLSLLETDSTRIAEKKFYELSELARLVYGRIKDLLYEEEVETLFHRGRTAEFLFEPVDGEKRPPEYAPLLEEGHHLTASLEISAFSVFLSELIRWDNRKFSPWSNVCTKSARIAYVPSGKADRAYFALATARKDASVHYATSASDAVSAILSRQADFVMLPYISADGQILSGTERFWFENDLFLSALVTVANDGEKLVYALFSTSLSSYVKTDGMLVCLEITVDSYAHLGRILSTIPVFGYRQTDVFAEMEEYGRVRARITLDGDGDDVALWLYLSFNCAGVSPLGIYPMLEI